MNFHFFKNPAGYSNPAFLFPFDFILINSLNVSNNMIHFLHYYIPTRILLEIGSVKFYWYGVFIVLGILSAIIVLLKLADRHKISKDSMIDLAFWLIFGGIFGARIYHIFLEISYYKENPGDIFKLWQGGLAIHGAIIAGLIVVWFFAKYKKLNFWILTSMVVTALALGQAVGRWGNYFNQELFGKPTNLPWGVPIEPQNRIAAYYNSQYFHPTFLYESIGNFIIFIILYFINLRMIKNNRQENFDIPVALYFVLYSILRFTMEFVRIDQTPVIWGLRFPQIISIILFAGALIYLKFKYKHIKDIALVFSQKA